MADATFGYFFVGIIVPMLFVVLATIGVVNERNEANRAAAVESRQKGLYEAYWFGPEWKESRDGNEGAGASKTRHTVDNDKNCDSSDSGDGLKNRFATTSDGGQSHKKFGYVLEWLEKSTEEEMYRPPVVMPMEMEMVNLHDGAKSTSTPKKTQKVNLSFSFRVEDADDRDKTPNYWSSSVYGHHNVGESHQSSSYWEF